MGKIYFFGSLGAAKTWEKWCSKKGQGAKPVIRPVDIQRMDFFTLFFFEDLRHKHLPMRMPERADGDYVRFRTEYGFWPQK